jgi:hypothetical protein
MKNVFIPFDISRLLITTETTIDRNFETDYMKGILIKPISILLHLFNNFIEITFIHFFIFLVFVNLF